VLKNKNDLSYLSNNNNNNDNKTKNNDKTNHQNSVSIVIVPFKGDIMKPILEIDPHMKVGSRNIKFRIIPALSDITLFPNLINQRYA
jgi:hypothetical protein